MKHPVALFFLLLVATSVSGQKARTTLEAEQEATASLASLPANQKWGWYHSLDWIEERILGRPGWQRVDVAKDTDGWVFYHYVSLDSTAIISVSTLADGIAVISFSFLSERPESKEWQTADFERVSENEWIDRTNNARIVRRYNGYWVKYRVEYEGFQKP